MKKLNKKEKWVVDYDKEIDHLFVGIYPMVRDARLFKIDNDINIYLNKKGEIMGIYIEYYKSDFIKKKRKLIQDIEKNETIQISK